jgi:filamentous hemagglutinin family protein
MTRSLRTFLLTSAALLSCGLPATASPDGANVVGGSASVQGQGTSSVTINQTSSRAIINWQHFNIGTGETTQFIQPTSTSVALNRITGSQDPTVIQGTLTANGRIFIVNPNGILFGASAVVNTAGLLATTSDITNENFMAGRHQFDIPGKPNASVVNEGRITATSGGFAALVAPGVRNSGTITATLGKVGLAAANTYTLDFYGDNLINVSVADSIAATVMDVGTKQPLTALVKNEGTLSANGGRVELTAASARKVVDSVINNTGVIEANAVAAGNGGTIVLSAATGASKGADAPRQVVKLSGTMSAGGKDAGQKGGKIVVTGEHIEVTGAQVSVAGTAGGGTALIGGDWGGGKPNKGLVSHERAKLESESVPTATTVTVDSASVIDASATQSGNGGKVILWSDQMTAFNGTIRATGGPLAGDGGFAEVSGRQLAFTGDVDLGALKGVAGTLLLDPEVLHINSSGIIELPAGHSVITTADIEKQLNSGKLGNLVIGSKTDDPANNIYVESNITWTSNTNLTLAALNNIEFKNATLITNKGAGDNKAAGSLVLRADSDGNGEGTVVLSRTQCGTPQCGLITRDFADFTQSTGTVSVYYNPRSYDGESKYLNEVDYASYVRRNDQILNQAAAYMLVNNLTDLQDINSNLSGNYAVGRNIDASATRDQTFTQIGTTSSPFVGVLDGLNYRIDGLTINSDNYNVGLFTKIGPTGEVRNLFLANVDITGLSTGSNIGALTAINAGTISNVQVSGWVQGGDASQQSNIGGLAGTNTGTIYSSSTFGNVTGVDNSNVGGLVGRNVGVIDYEYGNLTGGFIFFSASSGVVIAGNNSRVGGLVGDNRGEIGGSFSVADVTGGANSAAGGLVGRNSGAQGCIDCYNYAFVPGLISSSVALGTVTAGTGSSVGGLVGENRGEIWDSSSSATVIADANSAAGGLVGLNSGFATSGYGFVPALISGSNASGSVTTQDYARAGGLVGENRGEVSNSFSTASVDAGANSSAGGLVGLNSGYASYYSDFVPRVTTSYATGPVVALANSYVGGLVGQNNGEVTQSWSGASATGGDNSLVGGLVGFNSGTISYAYSIGPATGDNSYVGGLVGLNLGTIDQTYATGLVTGRGESMTGGLVASQSGSIFDTSQTGSTTASYWDKDTTKQNSGVGDDAGQFQATGLTTADARKRSSYEDFNFDSDWFVIDGQTRPFLRSEWSNNITNAHQLQLVELDKSANYFMTQNIDFATARSNPSDMWSSAGFVPIGSVSQRFEGTFQGLGLTIDNLYIAPTESNVNNIGLFAAIGGEGSVRDLNLTHATILANSHLDSSISGQFVGTLAGSNSGMVSNVTVSGQIDGGNRAGVIAGGLVGQNGMFDQAPGAATISRSSAAVKVTLGDGVSCFGADTCNGGWNNAGGLVGFNTGTISQSSASGNVQVGSNSFAGGLVGASQTFLNSEYWETPRIESSFATGNVRSAGTAVSLGGLVGYNAPGSEILTSYATGNVNATANLASRDCSSGGPCQFVSAGGLVGQNQGIISGAVFETPDQTQASRAGFTLLEPPTCGAGQTCATGMVNVGSNGTAGGLVAQNDGIIVNAFALGNITGAAGTDNISTNGQATTLGGLVGSNSGAIGFSHAHGNVGNLDAANLQLGGLVGDNSGIILTSYATGQIRAGNNSVAGGLVGGNGPGDFNCNGCTVGDGHNNFGLVANSFATGNVTVGSTSLAGGLAGAGNGFFINTAASGNVTGGANSVLGGLVGGIGAGEIDSNSGAASFSQGSAANVGNSNPGVIAGSSASGSVTSTGPNSIVGGLVGVNFGIVGIPDFIPTGASPASNLETARVATVSGPSVSFDLPGMSTSSGAVTGTSNSFLGGIAGINLGLIKSAETSSNVTGLDGNNIAGGVAGLNFGTVQDSSSTGTVASGPNSMVGTLVGANATFINFPDGTLPFSSFPTGTTSGSPGTVGGSNPTASQVPAFSSPLNGCGDTGCVLLSTGILPSDPTPAAPPPPPEPQPEPQPQSTPKITPPPTFTLPPPSFQQASLTQGDLVNIQQPDSSGTPGTPGRPQQPGAPRNLGGAAGVWPSSGMPPPGETRFIKDQIVLQIGSNVSRETLDRLARELGLTIIASQELGTIGTTAYQFQITGGRSVADVIRAFEANRVPAFMQPNYQYSLTQEAEPKDVDLTASIPPQTGPAQYILRKLRLNETHQLVKGSNVLIAVIDSEVDANHPDLQGAIVRRFNASGGEDKPHAHGTGMAGAIAAQRRLTGTAPGSRVLAVNAFSATASSAESTTFQILKGIDWAINNNARVINMSFAGPFDPTLQRAMKNARDKGIVLVAAAGNAGPKSPPLFPGADPSVIAVTATDVDDKLFTMANRGRYIALAAPGVDILVPAPAGSYQTTTGTSVATAVVSGVVALLLERDPTLTPNDIRRILTTTAKRMGTTKDRDDSYGSGVIDVYQAVTSLSASKP